MRSSEKVTVEVDVPAVMRDGIILRANLYRPAGKGPWPVLLSRLPYGKDAASTIAGIDLVQAARRGYIVAVQDTRGRYSSDGDWDPMRHERDDGFDTVAWASALPGSDGQVGMFGGSYLGFAQWAAAHRPLPELKAISPLMTWSEPLNELWLRDGVVQLGMTVHWELSRHLDTVARRAGGSRQAVAEVVAELDSLAAQGYWALPIERFGPLRRHIARSRIDEAIAWLDNPRLADYVRVAPPSPETTPPSLNIGGWYDVFLKGTIDNYHASAAAGIASQLVVGPWSHLPIGASVGEVNFGLRASPGMLDLESSLMDIQLSWFDRWLKRTTPGDQSPVWFFVMGENCWRFANEWPPSDVRETSFFLHGDGSLQTYPPGRLEERRFTYDPTRPVPTLGGALLMSPEFPAGPFDQRSIERREDVLTYTSPPLEQPLEVTGPIRVRLWAGSSAPCTDFVARLCDVHPDGTSFNLTDGILRTSFASSRPQALDLDLWATSNLFRRGHRIRVHITSSCFPRWDRNLNTGAPGKAPISAHQTVVHGPEHPSQIALPVRTNQP